MRSVAQPCPTLCDPLDCSPPGSSVHGIPPDKNIGVGCHALLQGSSQPKDQTHVSCISCVGKQIFYHCATREAHKYQYIMVLKIKFKNPDETKNQLCSLKSCPHHGGWMILFYIILRRLPAWEWQICEQRNEFPGREQNRPLNWAFFLKLWSWQSFFFFFSPKVIWLHSGGCSLAMA